jgi:hypothetical protein
MTRTETSIIGALTGNGGKKAEGKPVTAKGLTRSEKKAIEAATGKKIGK